MKNKQVPPTTVLPAKNKAVQTRTATALLALLAALSLVLGAALTAHPADAATAHTATNNHAQLTIGQSLSPGDTLSSADGTVTLSLTSSGDIVIAKTAPAVVPVTDPLPPTTGVKTTLPPITTTTLPITTTKTLYDLQKHGVNIVSGSVLVLDPTGNLVLVSPTNKLVWSTLTNNQGVQAATLLDNGNLIMSTSADNPAQTAIWSTRTGITTKPVSTNLSPWAGYVAYPSPTKKVTYTSSTWRAPTYTCTKPSLSTLSAGIDGAGPALSSGPTAEQAGIIAGCVLVGNSYVEALAGWYQAYPSPPVSLLPTDFSITPGDIVTATVQLTKQNLIFTLANVTTNTTKTYTLPNKSYRGGSAECTEENPAPHPVQTQFGSLTISNCTLTTTAAPNSQIPFGNYQGLVQYSTNIKNGHGVTPSKYLTPDTFLLTAS